MDRRNLLKVGSGLLFGCATREVIRSGGMNRPVLRTKLCDVLGIEYPLVQGGMGGVAGWEMAAEVSRAGALGSFSAAGQTVEGVKEMIEKVRGRTSKPFSVNLLLPADLRNPPAVSDDRFAAVQAVLNRIRAIIGLP